MIWALSPFLSSSWACPSKPASKDNTLWLHWPALLLHHVPPGFVVLPRQCLLHGMLFPFFLASSHFQLDLDQFCSFFRAKITGLLSPLYALWIPSYSSSASPMIWWSLGCAARGSDWAVCVFLWACVCVCSGIAREESGLCFTIVHHSLVTGGLVTDVGWAELGCWSHRATVPLGQLCRGHSVEAPHLSRSRNWTHLTIFRVICPLWPFPALGFAFAICTGSPKLHSLLWV